MPALAPSLRKNLETTVKDARDQAEEAARIALQRLAVDAREPFPSTTEEQCALRITLRARGKQLGDLLERARPDAAGRLDTMPGLVTECAYEHWHRLLFARFLAENGLLMHPEGVAVSLAECEELAPEEGLPDGWAVATRYAARMLPQIFRPDDPLLQVTLAPESRQALERKVADLPPAVFLADDSLGWVYQFWQARRKEQVNKSGEKIDGRIISAVTQLFTEHYMVAFLLHNSLGAWWAARHPGQPLPLAEGEVDYLRRLEDGHPAAGAFAGWPDRAADLRILDPCGGSGHFIVVALDLLARMRMLEEGIAEREAIDAVLRDNLFMLEIDPRCTQIAAFALAMAAWRRGGYRALPQLHIACSGLPVTADAGEWARLVPPAQRSAMRFLHTLFRQAPDLGSLIDPHSLSELGLFKVDFAELRAAVRAALEREELRVDAEQQAIGVVAQGLADAAELLAGRYHLLITNVPYLGGKKQDQVLREFCEKNYFDAKADLATVFVERCRQFCALGGVSALVTPQNWLFLGSYKRLRERLLQNCAWNLVVRLGPGAFETISGEVVNVALLLLTNTSPRVSQSLYTLDAAASRTIGEKTASLCTASLHITSHASQLANPDATITIERISTLPLLNTLAVSPRGIVSGDTDYWIRRFWEVPAIGFGWRYLQSTVLSTQPYSGREHIINWSTDGKGMNRPGLGNPAYGHHGVAISQMNDLPCTLYTGELYDNNTAAIVPHEVAHVGALWAFCSSPAFRKAIRHLNQKLNVDVGYVTRIPFDLSHWQAVANAAGPLPEPYSDNPTQWLFKGNIPGSTEPLQVAVARLLGYRWPEQDGDDLAAHVDADGIVPLTAMTGQLAAAERLRALLVDAYGSAWSHAQEEALLAGVEFAGKSLEGWLRDGYFRQHCKLFHNHPFIWHIWDGRRDGFAALINYHKHDRRLLEKLIYTYLGDWIVRQQEGQRRGKDGADARLVAALQLQERLKLILAGEPPYDIYVRWKKPHEQPIGWEPDLNDGVRLNIRPFMIDDEHYAKAPSILRVQPNIKWGIDRGTNPDGSKRDNDVHLTVAARQAARETPV
jgi:hypothetical protein